MGIQHKTITTATDIKNVNSNRKLYLYTDKHHYYKTNKKN